jgi:hypothetical protein
VIVLEIIIQILSILTQTNMSSSKKIASENAEHLALLEKQYKDLGETIKLLKKALGVRRPRAASEPGAGSAWSDWPTHAIDTFGEEYKEHLASSGKTADRFGFAKVCKDSLHVDEWKEFEAKWKTEHPKVEKPKSAPKAKGGAKPKAEELKPASEGEGEEEKEEEEEEEKEEEKASSSLPAAAVLLPKATAVAAKSKAPSKAAEKAAAKAAAVAAASEAAKADPPVPWKYRGKDYLKNDKNQIWTVGPDGAVGDWHGTYDGKKVEKSDGPV